jgi:Uma2 family endonuclease
MSATAIGKPLMTTEELLAMPDDGVERWLLEGVLWEKHPDPHGDDMTKRNRFHSRVMTCVAFLLEHWLRGQPEPRGQVVCGEAGFVLRRKPDSTVGIDVAYVGPDVVATQTDETTLFEGPPVLAVEILSPNTTVQEITGKIKDYLANKVQVVWVIHPDFQTVTVHRPKAIPILFGAGQTLTGEPELAGFSAAVTDFFL